MITFQIVARVEADRRLVLTLPDEVPVGEVEIAIAVAGVGVPTPRTVALPEPATRIEPVTHSANDGAQRTTRAELNVARATPAPLDAATEIIPADLQTIGFDAADAASMLVDVPRAELPKPATRTEAPRTPRAEEPSVAAEARPSPKQENGATEAAAKAVAPAGRPEAPATAPSRPAAAVTRPPAEASPPEAHPRGPLRLGTVLGEYRLDRKLGQGRLGPVFAAYQQRLRRHVAVKVLDGELADDPGAVERFDRQARVLTKLGHQNIIPCHDAGEGSGHHFLVTDLMEEGSIGACLKRMGKLSIGNSLYVVLASCKALQHAHEQKVLHGALKPENILIGSDHEIKIADLGLAEVPGTGHVDVDTSLFLAPEQIREGRLDRRSDLYSLGCLLYALLTGEAPFQGETVGEVVRAKEAGSFAPARQKNREVPEKLDAVLAKLLAVDPAARYPSCAALSLDLEALKLASSRLNFPRAGASPAPAPRTLTPPPPRKLRMRELESVEGYWYAQLTDARGQKVTQKVTYRQMLALVKQQLANAETLVSRHRDRDFACLATFSEFQQLFDSQDITRARATRDKARAAADPGGTQYHSVDVIGQAAPGTGRKATALRKVMSRRQWLNSVLASKKKRPWVFAGAAAILVGVALFLARDSFWFWRLKRKVRSWFGH